MTNDDVTTVRYGTERMAVFYLNQDFAVYLRDSDNAVFFVPAYRINNVD